MRSDSIGNRHPNKAISWSRIKTPWSFKSEKTLSDESNRAPNKTDPSLFLYQVSINCHRIPESWILMLPSLFAPIYLIFHWSWLKLFIALHFHSLIRKHCVFFFRRRSIYNEMEEFTDFSFERRIFSSFFQMTLILLSSMRISRIFI